MIIMIPAAYTDLCEALLKLATSRPVHPPYSSVFVTEFNPDYGNTNLVTETLIS